MTSENYPILDSSNEKLSEFYDGNSSSSDSYSSYTFEINLSCKLNKIIINCSKDLNKWISSITVYGVKHINGEICTFYITTQNPSSPCGLGIYSPVIQISFKNEVSYEKYKIEILANSKYISLIMKEISYQYRKYKKLYNGNKLYIGIK